MDERLNQYDEKMSKSVDALVSEYASIRAGRANPHILDKLKVDYYGTPTPFQQVANISVPEARMLQIQPWESSLIKDIEKAVKYPLAAKDAQGRLLCGAAVGITQNIMERVDALVKAKVDVIVVEEFYNPDVVYNYPEDAK